MAQALALAGEQRPFAELADPDPVELAGPDAWRCSMPPPWSPGTAPSASTWVSCSSSRRRARTSPIGSGPWARSRGVLKHIEPVIDHFESTSSAGSVEVASDHALVEVVPRRPPATSRPPVRADPGTPGPDPGALRPGPALITETECAPVAAAAASTPSAGSPPHTVQPMATGRSRRPQRPPVRCTPSRPSRTPGPRGPPGTTPVSWTRAPRTDRQPSSRSS